MDRRENAYRLRTNIIVPIYKNKGYKLQCHNYRETSLLYTRYKILVTVINNRLKNIRINILGEYQAGFSSGKSTIDEIFTFKNLLETAWEYNVKIHIISSLIFREPTIGRDKLYEIMKYLRIPNKLIKLTKSTMEDSTYNVMT
jgi:hypothetical protein